MSDSWIQTYSGKQLWLNAPMASDVHPVDVAHALSMLCRYGGHSASFYSVAEHCVLMSRAVPEEDALWALLHDATEAYLGDVVTPLKRMLHSYQRIEDDFMDVVMARFGLTGDMPDSVRDADARIVLDERAALMLPTPAPWKMDHLEPLGVRVEGWEPEHAEQEYSRRLIELGAMTGDEFRAAWFR